MRTGWRAPAATGAAIVVAEAAAYASGADPRPLLLAAVVVVAAVAAWSISGLVHALADELRWPASRLDDEVRTDWQIAALRVRITHGTDDGRAREAVGRTLVALTDDWLLAEHGVDRRTDPATARSILGADLDRFVTDPAAARLRARDLERVVALIETTQAEGP